MMDVPIANIELNGTAPCTFVEATLQLPACTNLSPIVGKSKILIPLFFPPI
jgi:hypothetical protein